VLGILPLCSAIRTCIRDSLHCFLYEIKLYEHCLLSGCPMRDLQLVQCTQIFILPIASVFQKKKWYTVFARLKSRQSASPSLSRRIPGGAKQCFSWALACEYQAIRLDSGRPDSAQLRPRQFVTNPIPQNSPDAT